MIQIVHIIVLCTVRTLCLFIFLAEFFYLLRLFAKQMHHIPGYKYHCHADCYDQYHNQNSGKWSLPEFQLFYNNKRQRFFTGNTIRILCRKHKCIISALQICILCFQIIRTRNNTVFIVKSIKIIFYLNIPTIYITQNRELDHDSVRITRNGHLTIQIRERILFIIYRNRSYPYLRWNFICKYLILIQHTEAGITTNIDNSIFTDIIR